MTGLILSDGERGDEDGQLFESGELMEPACVKNIYVKYRQNLVDKSRII